MRTSIIAVLSVIGLGVVYGQGPIVLPINGGGSAILWKNWQSGTAADITPEAYRLKTIHWLLSLPSPLEGGNPQLHSMGDEAAVDILKILGTRPSLNAAEQQSALDIIHMSFEQTASIVNSTDRKPMAAAFLLQYLDASAEDAGIKARISQETQFLKAAVSTTPNPLLR